MVTAFADTLDVEDRWRPLTPAESSIAETLLDDASDMIRVRWPDVDARIAAGSLSARSALRVTANMVKRAMMVGTNEGVDSVQQTAGPFSVTNQFTNPTASLYLTSEEARVFDGIGGQRRAFAVDLY